MFFRRATIWERLFMVKVQYILHHGKKIYSQISFITSLFWWKLYARAIQQFVFRKLEVMISGENVDKFL